jgi:hypothetical protein
MKDYFIFKLFIATMLSQEFHLLNLSATLLLKCVKFLSHNWLFLIAYNLTIVIAPIFVEKHYRVSIFISKCFKVSLLE